MAVGGIFLPIYQTGTGHTVKYIDFDGTILKEEIVLDGNPSTPPTIPTHEYLIFNSWNISNSDIHKNTNIGAIYDTVDNKTYISIVLNSGTTGLSPTFFLNKSTSDLMTINWGDGTQDTTTATGDFSINKIYVLSEGKTYSGYTISISCDGVYNLGNYTVLPKLPFTNYTDSLKKIYMGSSINQFTFSTTGNTYIDRCLIENISINNSITSLNENSMANCKSLININIPSGVTTISGNSFYNCHSLTNVNIPNSVLYIGDNCFFCCYSLTDVNIPDSVSYIGIGCFHDCNSLVNVNIPYGVTIIKNSTFMGCYSLTNIYIPDSVTGIEHVAFWNCYSLINVNIPTGVTFINFVAFSNCYSLTSVNIPSSVLTLGANSFMGCYSIVEYIFNSETPPSISVDTFDHINLSCRIYVPDLAITTYKEATNWVEYTNFIFPISEKI